LSEYILWVLFFNASSMSEYILWLLSAGAGNKMFLLVCICHFNILSVFLFQLVYTHHFNLKLVL
jgi:hypothetical protein